MIQIDTRNIRRYENDLALFARSALPFATKETVNRAAKNTRKVALDFADSRMILRNTWTKGSIQYERARGNSIGGQMSRVGSYEAYMALQEHGGVKDPTSGKTVAIAMPKASGESSIPRRRMVRAVNRLNRITLSHTSTRTANRRQRNRVAVEMAGKGAGADGKFVFLELGRKSGIYRVTGRVNRRRLVKVWSMSRPSVVIRPRPWLAPAVDRIAPYLPRYYEEALVAQLRRARVFGY